MFSMSSSSVILLCTSISDDSTNSSSSANFISLENPSFSLKFSLFSLSLLFSLPFSLSFSSLSFSLESSSISSSFSLKERFCDVSISSSSCGGNSNAFSSTSKYSSYSGGKVSGCGGKFHSSSSI